jgi:hypothetical protein
LIANSLRLRPKKKFSNPSTSLGIELNDLSATYADTHKMVLEQLGA